MPVHNPRHSRFFWRSSAIFCIMDHGRQFTEVNSAWEKTLGLSTGRLLAKTFFDFVHPEDRPSSQYFFDQIDAGLPSVSFSNRFRHHDDTYRQILWEINGAASAEYAYYGVGMDITAREQPMIADEILSVLQEGVVLQYANGTIGACNPSAERILGLSSEQMMGWTLVDPDWRLIREDGLPFPTETHPAICTLRTGQSYSDVVMGIKKPDESVIWIRVNAYPLWRDDVTTPYAVVISFSDVSLYKETEFSLRHSGANHSTPAAAASDNNYDLWDWNLETHEVTFSPGWKEMLGFSESELPNKIETWHQRIHPSDYKRVLADIQNHLEGATTSFNSTHRLQHKDGSYRWVSSRAVLVRDPQGKPHRLVGTHVDITESRQISEQSQETEKKYRQLMDLESDAIFLVDADTLDILDVNRAASQLYGYSREELLAIKKPQLSAQPDKTAHTIKKGTKHTSQQFHKKQDGTVFPVELTVNPFIWQGRQVLTLAARDLTERQRIESALWESEAKYRQLFEAASVPTVVYDANSQHFFDVNRATIDLYGYTKEEWLNMTTEDISAEPVKKRAAFSTGKKVQVIPLRWHKRKDGTVFPVEISLGNSYLFQGRSLVCATLRDISERKAAEEALRAEKDFVSTLVQASPAFFFAINPDRRVRMMNRAMLASLEYSLEEVVNVDYLTTFVPEPEQALVATEFEMLSKSMQPSLMEYHVMTQSGRTLLVEWHSRAVVKTNGILDYFFGVGIDVTERRKAQGHLRLFKSIVESSEEAIAIGNPEGVLVYVNPAHEKLFGHLPRDNKQLNFRNHYPQESLEIWDSEVMTALQQGGSWEGELHARDSQGNTFPVWERVDAVRDANGKILFYFGLMHDISERQRMWETLRKQWEENQMIFNTVPAMIWYRDSDNRLVRTNKLAQESFGREEGKSQLYSDCQDVIRSGKPQHGIVHTFQNLRGETRWVQLDKLPYRDAHGHLTGVIVFATDITESKQSQLSLQMMVERMQLVIKNMPLMFLAFDEENHIVEWNRACEEVTGFSSDEMVGSARTLEWLYPDLAERERMLRGWEILEGGQGGWENQITCRNNKLKTIAWSCVAKRYPIATWRTWYIGQDVTFRKQSEQSFRQSQALLAHVFESAKVGVCLTDDRGRFVQVNRAFAGFYGFTSEELLGQVFTSILPSAQHSDAVREYYSLLMTQDSPTLLRRRDEQHRDGHPIEVLMISSRVILEDKRRLLISVVSKTSEIKRSD